MKSREYTVIVRAIHWAIAMCIFVILLTVFLRMTWLNRDSVSQLLQHELSNLRVDISLNQVVGIAKKIRQPMWDWHIYAGYALLVLFYIRFVLAASFLWPMPNPFAKDLKAKERLQMGSYLAFYVLSTCVLVSGFFIVNGPKQLKALLESMHTRALWYVLPFVMLHFAGIWLAERGTQKGIVSKMIVGKRQE